MSSRALSADVAGDVTEPPQAASPAVTFAVFGKLPQRRDFVSSGLPPALLAPLERYLEDGMAAARSDLGPDFEADYLVMPLWRFWLGASCFGVAALGALIPSVDGVGRNFPLAILAIAAEGGAFELPLIDPMEAVFAGIEMRLMAIIAAETDAPFDLAALTAGLRPPHLVGEEAQADRDDGLPAGLGGVLMEARADDHRRLAAGQGYFWTAGHGGERPVLFSRAGLPSAADFAAMVCGVAPPDGPAATVEAQP
ncbi:type VI secretion system-associated protein TagF [Jiella mangrovi]|uniref:Type VI secretion system-associated protein TagF n=1 Tax=Jiella mangrovi TaxID=2821407 RepID=A0ABS4BLP2_9HYPH|nr:type VI secretion system-associated protein TagF [Jiella mangrovi]MBP0617639.1 type VI secretion system-associated protein TagF [Jiella mangrovi]